MQDTLNTYTLQELYKQPIEPIPWVVEDLLGTRVVFPGWFTKSGKKLAGTAALSGRLPWRALSGVRDQAGTKFFTSLWRTVLGGCISAHCG